ncbi:MAG TPA: TonB-dependent receptor, partial [Longimicrobiaceae bacterium]
RNRLTVGLDLLSSLAELLSEPNSADTPAGLSAQRVPRSHIYTVDYAGNVLHDFGERLTATTSFGLQLTSKQYQTLFASGTGLGAPDVTLIQTAQTINASNTFSEQRSLGLFAQEQFAWSDRLFVTGALRMDNNSAFGSRIHRLLYPKASLSWVLSDEPALSSFFERIHTGTFKFRTAWGEAGRAPDPYSATQTFTIDKVTLGTGTTVSTGSALRTSAYGNPDLKPERGTELEVGFDAGFLHDRVGMEFTFYDKRMNDVIVAQAIPGSSGFASSRFMNLGRTLNRGVELGINATPVQHRRFTWESRLNLSTNHNELLSFGDPAKINEFVFSSYGSTSEAAQQHRVGYPLAGWWARFPLKAADGTDSLNAARNAVVLDTATRFVGPAYPTREIGFSNTFTIFGNLRLYSLFDLKSGFYVFNYKEFNRCNSNTNCWAVNDPAASDLDKVVARTARAPYIEKGDFIKLRDLSLTYVVPSRLLRNFRARTASITLAGHNLGLWTDYTGIDPEVNTAGNRGFARVDAYAAPMNRRITVSVNLGY